MITEAIRQTYDADGVVCLRGAFDSRWLGVAARAIERSRASPGPMYVDYSADTKPGTYCGDFWVWPQVQEMRDFIFVSPAARLVGEVMDVTSVMLVTDNWVVREAGLGSPGGHTITQNVPQIIFNLIDFGMSMQEAIDAPKISFVEPNSIRVEQDGWGHRVE